MAVPSPIQSDAGPAVALSWQKVVAALMVVSCIAFQTGGTTRLLRTLRKGMVGAIESDTASSNSAASVAAAPQDYHQAEVDAWFDEIAGEGETTCRYIEERKQIGQWPDPNRGKIFLRLVTTEPHFYVSVHNQKYDNLRWNKIFERRDLLRNRGHSAL